MSRKYTLFADRTGAFVRQLLEPAFLTVPAAADMPALFQAALEMSGTPRFPVPDVYYESQKLENEDMASYLQPVSQTGAITFSSAVHTVLCKDFPAGVEMVQAGLFLACRAGLLVHCMGCSVGMPQRQTSLLTMSTKVVCRCLMSPCTCFAQVSTLSPYTCF